MKKSNCLIFALKMYRQHGGYIVIRRSLAGGPIPHFLWLSKDDGDKLIHYHPVKRRDNWMKWVHKLCFKGEIAIGDSDYRDKR